MSYSQQDLINAGIPQDLTIESIYQEYKRGGLTQLPRVTMSNTLRNRNPSIKTLGDLFSSALGGKCIAEFENGILSNGPRLRALYDAQTKTYTLPATLPSPLTLENGLRAFLPEYLAAKKERAKFVNKQVPSVESYCTVVERLFDEIAPDNSRETISRLLKNARQNVDNKIKQAQQEFGELFLEGKTVDQISVQPALAAMVQKVKDDFPVPGDSAYLKELTGIRSSRIMLLLTTILGYKILDSGVVVNSNDSGRMLDLSIGSVKSLLKDYGIPCPIDDFQLHMDEAFQDKQLKADLETYSRTYHEFEILHDIQGKELLAVKWDCLNDLTSEIIRILYDMDIWDPKRAMSKVDLRREWERRAKLVGRDIKFTPQYTHWRLSATKNGYVYLNKTKSDPSFIPGQQYVYKQVLAHPTWTFDDLYHQAHKDGYTNIYPLKSLRAYFTDAKDDQRVEKALKDAIRFLDNTANRTLAFSDLTKKIAGTGNPIKAAPFESWLRKNDQVFDVFKLPGSTHKSVKLLNKKAKLVTTATRIKPAPAPVQTPAPTPVQAPAVDWASIDQYLQLQVSEIQAYPELQGITNKMFLVLKDGQANIAPNSCFLRWLPNLTQSNTMGSTAKDKFRVDLILSAEAYFKCFYQLKYKQDIQTEIRNDPAFYAQKTIGLGTMISFLVKKGILPDKSVRYKWNSLSLAIVKALDTVLTARNDIIGHPNVTFVLADNVMSTQIHDTLLVFLYLASKL